MTKQTISLATSTKGTPSKDVLIKDKATKDNRGAIISAARKLFTSNGYQSVSVRKIAKEAGVDPGLIRYYFGSKLELFTAVIKETIEPVHLVLEQAKQSADISTPEAFLKTYYRVMAQYPSFPRLVYSMANMQESETNAELLDVFNALFRPQELMIFEILQQAGALRGEVDAECARLSFFSLMVFPFIMPSLVRKKLKIELTPEFLEKLAVQNAQLLKQGLMNATLIEQPSSAVKESIDKESSHD